MILVVDGLNRHRYTKLLDQMFELRARVFRDRLGWDVKVEDGKEIDEFDALDPAYILGLNDEGRVVACVRALQTTGPHMLSDVFSAILDGEPPLRSATIWESTRFCVDTDVLDRGTSRHSVSFATCELMVGALEYSRDAGITDIVTVIDPIMNRVLKRSDCAPYDYLGSTTPMGKTSAMAALLDCTDERIDRVRAFAGIEGDVFADAETEAALADDAPAQGGGADMGSLFDLVQAQPEPQPTELEQYCLDQVAAAETDEERDAARRLAAELCRAGMVSDRALAAINC
ncbi:acyl-homoserine-lactone synthase [Salipiger mucosus]|uniref:Acyl-homoserine-lactone synthase n=1 Tax=Salipiger mucosus DSM 16094 TaxID=1123237 RepID=S9QFM5_9RHOB|nr:acyl-homoserine-lactone synthase [Salipiger mucosus]EPX78418.1 Autoinducer synthesis protein LuxI [Salipiger mucosus DSM 16094]